MARTAEGAGSWQETPPFRAALALSGWGGGWWLLDEAIGRYYPVSPSVLRQLREDWWLHSRLGYKKSVWGGTWAVCRQGPAYGVFLQVAGRVGLA